MLDVQWLRSRLDEVKAALARHRPAGGFMNAASPGVIALFQPNEHYPTQDAYLEALAEAMRPEYEAIVAAGATITHGPAILSGRAGPMLEARRRND